MKIIQITVLPTGESRIETKGFSGAECREASRYLEQALGTTVNDRPTAEFHNISDQVCQANYN